jgi:hypothetical protein
VGKGEKQRDDGRSLRLDEGRWKSQRSDVRCQKTESRGQTEGNRGRRAEGKGRAQRDDGRETRDEERKVGRGISDDGGSIRLDEGRK